jgi:hypothetical protein
MVEVHGGLPPEWRTTAETTVPVPSLAEWAEHWLAHLTTVFERTRDDYRRRLDLHVLPLLGSLRPDRDHRGLDP